MAWLGLAWRRVGVHIPSSEQKKKKKKKKKPFFYIKATCMRACIHYSYTEKERQDEGQVESSSSLSSSSRE